MDVDKSDANSPAYGVPLPAPDAWQLLPPLDWQALVEAATGRGEQFTALHGWLEDTLRTLWPAPESATARGLARIVAVLATKIELLEAVADCALQMQDFAAVGAVQKALDRTTHRLVAVLAAQRRASEAERARVPVVLADQVTSPGGASARSDAPVARCSLAHVRRSFPPRAYRQLTRVRLEHAGVACDVAIESLPTPGCIRGARRWFVCPRCQRRAGVLGCVGGLGWVCRTCGRWRTRGSR